MKRRYAVLAPGEFENNAKTAHGVIRYGSDDIVAVIDPAHAGSTVDQVLPHLRCNAPFVADLESALVHRPTSLLIGVAPQGGALPQTWRDEIVRALHAELEIVSGLHDVLGDDPEFAQLARRHGTRIWDVRLPPDVPLFSGAAYDVAAPVILTVGSDCAVGKMTVSLELAAAAARAGVRGVFVPTGQTGIMIAGWGIAVDRVISDFAPGAAEQLVLEAQRRDAELIVVEGQGSILHPAYAPVTLALLYGSAPDALVLVVDPTRRTIESYGTPQLSYRDLVRAYETVCGWVKPAPVVAIALNTLRLDAQQAGREAARAREQTGLPVADVVRDGPDALYEAIATVKKRKPLHLEVPA